MDRQRHRRATATGSRSASTCAGTTLAARGWTQEGGDLWETLDRLDGEGCARYVVTDVNKDGMLKGPNVDLLREVCARTDRPVVASGGVSTLEDIRVLRTLVGDGVEGAIIGSALYRDAFTLPRGPRRGGPAVTSASPARRRLATGNPYEECYGYSRAVRTGDRVLVSGCTSLVDGEVCHPGDAAAQARVALDTAVASVVALGGSGGRHRPDPHVRRGPRRLRGGGPRPR